jgi:hypothetical protein
MPIVFALLIYRFVCIADYVLISPAVFSLIETISLRMYTDTCYIITDRTEGLFFCHRMKSELAGISMPQDSFKASCDEVVRTIAKDEFANVAKACLNRQ